MSVIIERLPPQDDHDAQKWLRLRGRIDRAPESTWKTRTINIAALADGSLVLEAEKAQLVADVEEYHARYLALQEALKEL